MCDEPPPYLCSLSVCMVDGTVRYSWCIRFLCKFCILYCDDVWLRVLCKVFSLLILFLMPFMVI